MAAVDTNETQAVAQDVPPGSKDDHREPTPMMDVEDGELPEEQTESRKRQCSQVEEQEDSQKRQRRDSQQSSIPPNDRQTERHEPERPKPATQEEKKRGKRLFGGLLNTLNQKSSNVQQRRRQEIEQRQQEKMQKQEAEDDQRRTEKAAKTKRIRTREQITYDEKVMKHKHSKKLAVARFLRTRAEPRIYYLPWKCTERQKDIIDKQIQGARREMDHQWQGFEERKQRHIAKYGIPTTREPGSSVGEPRGSKGDVPNREGLNDSNGSRSSASPVREDHRDAPPRPPVERKEDEELADVMEEAGEDAAIY